MKKKYTISLEEDVVEDCCNKIESSGGKLSTLIEYLLKKFSKEKKE